MGKPASWVATGRRTCFRAIRSALPIGGGSVGSGGGSHSANEFYVIEGAGKTYGYASAEKSVATVLYNYAGMN